MSIPISKISLAHLFLFLVFSSCSKEEIKNPVAAFSNTSDNGYLAPTSITFKNQSTDAREYTWDFGDGSPISNNVNPIHVYSEPGTYTITLIAANGERVHQVQEEISVFALPTADFDYMSNNDFKAPSSITFQNKSLNSETYLWDFGDGETSTETNPVHTYDQPGTYTVQLTATNTKGNDIITVEVIIVPLETAEQLQLDKLKGVWVVQTVTDDNGDRTGDFANLTLTFSGTYAEGGTYKYSLTGTRPDPSPWPANGTWKFGTNKPTDIIRDPNTNNEVPMSYAVSETDMVLQFTVPDGSAGWPGGRVNSVTGEWTYTFTKK